jgi:hypothetical protein
MENHGANGRHHRAVAARSAPGLARLYPALRGGGADPVVDGGVFACRLARFKAISMMGLDAPQKPSKIGRLMTRE